MPNQYLLLWNKFIKIRNLLFQLSRFRSLLVSPFTLLSQLKFKLPCNAVAIYRSFHKNRASVFSWLTDVGHVILRIMQSLFATYVISSYHFSVASIDHLLYFQHTYGKMNHLEILFSKFISLNLLDLLRMFFLFFLFYKYLITFLHNIYIKHCI